MDPPAYPPLSAIQQAAEKNRPLREGRIRQKEDEEFPVVGADAGPYHMAVMVEAIDRVLTDATVRDAMIERGRARAAALGPPASVRRMRDVLQPLLVGAGS